MDNLGMPRLSRDRGVPILLVVRWPWKTWKPELLQDPGFSFHDEMGLFWKKGFFGAGTTPARGLPAQ